MQIHFHALINYGILPDRKEKNYAPGLIFSFLFESTKEVVKIKNKKAINQFVSNFKKARFFIICRFSVARGMLIFQ